MKVILRGMENYVTRLEAQLNKIIREVISAEKVIGMHCSFSRIHEAALLRVG